MNKEYLKETIIHHRDMKNNFWTAMLVSIGGTIGLTLNPDNLYKVVLICIGIVFIGVFLRVYLNGFKSVDNLVNELKEDK